MYESTFNMERTPFVRNIPTELLFESSQMAEALARLEYTAENQLFAVVTADAGCGKSTLIRRFNDALPKDKYLLLYVSDSKLTPKWLYKSLLDQLGLEAGFYRGDAKLQKNMIDFGAYVAMFPQLIAGPIVRYTDIAAELKQRSHTAELFSSGAFRFTVGLAKKILIANPLGELCDIFRESNEKSVLFFWVYAIAFCLHIYFDFSGYSDMAIGLGKIFGFHFLENFNYPYISRSATEFWRRWHMSLGGFFRDYVYIPLGGNRKHQYLNLFIVWFLTGFWHGASWNFIMWGLWFGALIIIEKLFLLKWLKKIPVLSNIYLLFVAVLGWVMFYFEDMGQMFDCFAVMFGAKGTGFWDISLELTLLGNIFWIILAVAFCCPIVPTVKKFVEERPKLQMPAKVLMIPANAVMLIMNTALLVGMSYNPFLYYKF